MNISGYPELKYSFILVPLLMISACSPIRVLETQGEEGFKINDYQTFDFYQTSPDADMVSEQYKQSIRLIKHELSEELNSLGLTQDSNSPELLVNIGIVVEDKVQTRETNLVTDPPMYIGQRNYTWKSEEVVTGRYREGTLSVHLVNTPNKSLVWSGEVQDIIPKKSEVLEEHIHLAIEKLFAEFHP